jgi:tellurite resistance protein
MDLVESRNQVIFAAFEAFQSDQDLDELIDTLQLVANYSGENGTEATIASASSRDAQQQQQPPSPLSANNTNTNTSAAVAEEVGDASEELLELVEALESDQKLTRVEADALALMVHKGDEYVMAAHDVYVSDQDVDDLIDTLQRIARRQVQQQDGKSSSDEDDEEEGTQEDDEEDDEAVQRIAQLKQLFRDGLLSNVETRKLMELAEDEDPKLMAAFDVFDSINDQEDLLDSLKRLLVIASSAGKKSEIDQFEEDDTTTVEEQFLQIASEMHLSPMETTALRRCLANEDTIVKAALRVYQLEQDAEDLKDTLMRVARFHVEQSTAESDTEEQESAFSSVEASLLERGRLTAAAVTKLENLHSEGDVVISAALDVYRIDGDIEELEDTLMRVTENL